MKVQFVEITRILARLSREIKNSEYNEADVIEWIGEVMARLELPTLLQQSIAFINVEDYKGVIPTGMSSVLQIARDISPTTMFDKCTTAEEVVSTVTETNTGENPQPVILDSCGKLIYDFNVAYYRPYFDLLWEYHYWTNSKYYKRNFRPVRLANHSFFNDLVCRENEHDAIYHENHNIEDEYTIQGDNFLFSFQEGHVACSYNKVVTDTETGYPLVPDVQSAQDAITYYVKMKMAEGMLWEGKEGAKANVEYNNAKYLHYITQAKNEIHMPSTVDEYENILQQTHRLIPRHCVYYDYFGSLNKKENRNFANNKNSYYSRGFRYGR